MKKCWTLPLWLVLGMEIGCVQLPTLGDGAHPAPAPRPVKPLPPAPPVVPEQVNDANAHEKAKALEAELDREAQADTAPPSPAPDVRERKK